MISKIFNLWHLLKGNLWFRPALYCIGFFLFLTITFYVETNYVNNYNLPDFMFHGSAADAKSIVNTLLSAMITMATLAISITIVVLSLAASQLGSRLIKTFMSQRKTKNFIGLFFGTVTACFVLAMILHARNGEATPPSISISFLFGLCLINLFVLLGFVHHVAQSCIADNIILQVSNELKEGINRLTEHKLEPHLHEEQDEEDKERAVKWPNDKFKTKALPLEFDKSGYLQYINYSELIEIAREEDIFVRVMFKSGHFIVQNEVGLHYYAAQKRDEEQSKEIKERLIECFIIGKTRTATQDIEYSIRHMVEIAIRALSPGINDSFTALHVLDQLAAALSELLEKNMLPEDLYDKKGQIRIKASQSDHADIILKAFEKIRFNGNSMPSVICHMLDIFKPLAKNIDDAHVRTALLQQVQGLLFDFKRIEGFVANRASIESDIEDLITSLS